MSSTLLLRKLAFTSSNQTQTYILRAGRGGIGAKTFSRNVHAIGSRSLSFFATPPPTPAVADDVDPRRQTTTSTRTHFSSSRRVFSSAVEDGSHQHQQQEGWMVNIRGGEHEDWLLGEQRDVSWFTGKAPGMECPGTDANGHLRSLPLPNMSQVTRASAQEYFDNSWTLYETMFAGLKGEEAFYRPPVHGLRHPQIFYYGHTPCFYINKLRVSGVLDKPINAHYESLFEVGVDEMVWDDMHKNNMMWPTVAEVHEYRKEVYETVKRAIATHPSLEDHGGTRPVTVDQNHPMWALFMGFEHERIHLETSSVLFREMPVHLVQTPEHWPPLHPSAYRENPTSHPVEGEHYPPNRMVAVGDDTSVDLGKPPSFPSFGWDNEYGERTMNVPPFEASEHMITNGEFWHFVSDGGYRNRDHWCDDGWAWRMQRNRKWPFFWVPVGPQGSHQFELRSIFEEIPMQWDWPVDVNYYEARAFCRWKDQQDNNDTSSSKSRSYRLLTEAEHHVIRHEEHSIDAVRNDVNADPVMWRGGEDFAHDGIGGSNLNFAFSSQSPVNSFAPSHTGHRDTTGNAWEWTEDHFNPLKGFEAHHLYDDYSAPYFDGKHHMIVSGSFISTGDEASVFVRSHFRPHFLQHSGFRLVSSDADAPATNLHPANVSGQKTAPAPGETTENKEDGVADENKYETKDLLNMYMGLHFPTSGIAEGTNVDPILDHPGVAVDGLQQQRFPQRVSKLLVSLEPKRTNGRALDIGCAVGGSSFELAKSFDEVEAFDFSFSFVDAAKQMQQGEEMKFQIPKEGYIHQEAVAVHDDGVDQAVRNKINFWQGDASHLKEYSESIGTFDGIVMSNVLDRLMDPVACLDGLTHVINQGGVVVMVNPFSWSEEFTHRSKWLGGYYDPSSGRAVYSGDHLHMLMEERGFEKIHEEQMPLLIREHQRKYQYIVSEATGWRKL